MSNSSYIAPIYEPVPPVNAFHGVPRFGRPSDITGIFSEDGVITDNVVDYALGTIFIAAFLFVTYVIFICLIFLFKCFCRGNKTRVFAGLAYRDDNLKGSDITLKMFRATLLFSTFVIVVSGFVFLVNGSIQFQNVADDVRDGTQGFIKLSDKVEATANSFITLGDDTVVIRDSLKAQVDEGLCSFAGGNSKKSAEFDEAALTLIDVLDGLQEFAKNEVTDIRDTFGANLEGRVNRVESTTDQYERILNPAFYAGPAIGLGFVFMTGLILAWLRIKMPMYFCVQTWFFLPLFFIFFTFSFIVIVGVGLVAVANAGKCMVQV